MSNRTYAIWLTVLLLAAFASGFCAAKATAAPPIDRPTSSAMLSKLETVAQAYWGPRGVTPPLPVQVYRAADLGPEIVGRGEYGTGRLWVLDAVLDRLRLKGDAGWAARVELCVIYIHERGHNGGLTHESGWTIMQPDAGGAEPPKCFKWAASPK